MAPQGRSQTQQTKGTMPVNTYLGGWVTWRRNGCFRHRRRRRHRGKKHENSLCVVGPILAQQHTVQPTPTAGTNGSYYRNELPSRCWAIHSYKSTFRWGLLGRVERANQAHYTRPKTKKLLDGSS